MPPARRAGVWGTPRQGHASEAPHMPATQPAAVQARPSDGLPTAVIEYSNVASVFGVILEKNLRVVAVEPNSAAQRAGIQAGDVITTVGRSAVTSSAGAKQAFRRSVTKSGQSISVTVTRNGKAVISAPVVAHSPVRSLKGPTPTPVPTNLDYF